MKGADRKRWKLTVAKRQGSGCETVAERSRRQTLDPRNTKRQRGRVRATSVRANAKSQDHQAASSRAAWPEWTAHVLTRRGLRRESGAEVSRGRSRDEAARKHSGAKDRRNEGKATREPVNRAQTAPTSAVRSVQARPTARTQNAPVVQPPPASRGEALRSPCGTQGTRQRCKR